MKTKSLILINLLFLLKLSPVFTEVPKEKGYIVDGHSGDSMDLGSCQCLLGDSSHAVIKIESNHIKIEAHRFDQAMHKCKRRMEGDIGSGDAKTIYKGTLIIENERYVAEIASQVTEDIPELCPNEKKVYHEHPLKKPQKFVFKKGSCSMGKTKKLAYIEVIESADFDTLHLKKGWRFPLWTSCD